MLEFDGIKKKKKNNKDDEVNSSPSFSVTEPFIVPSESLLEDMTQDVVIIGKQKPIKTSFLGSPLGLQTKQKEKKTRKRINYKYFYKSLVGLVVIVLFGILAIRGYQAKAQISLLSGDSKKHLTAAMTAIDQGDMASAISEANLANDDIKKLKLLTQSWGQDIKFIEVVSPDSKLVANEKLLDATYTIVNTLTEVNQKITQIGGSSGSSNIEGKGSDFIFNISASQNVITSLVEVGERNLEKSRAELVSAREGLDSEYKNEIDNAISSIDKTTNSLQFIQTLTSKDLPWLSGTDGKDKKILIIFQNNAELRGASGGSLGSFGIANFSDGKLRSIDFAKNIYKLDQAFEATGTHIEVPKELVWLRGGATWTLKDSGWSVDGNTASKNILDFYHQETGESADGIIMIDTTAVISLLKTTGPIEMKNYDITVDANNFRDVMEYEVHKGYFTRPDSKTENEPKKILSDLMPIFMNKIFENLGNKDKSMQLLSSLSSSLKQKDITFYFDNSDFQTRIDQLGYSGSVLPSWNDYLYVNNSNINGAKSSLNISETINLNVEIANDGNIKNSLNLTRKHMGNGVWPDGININFTRILFPENSTITQFSPVSGNYQEYYNHGNPSGNYYLSGEAGKTTLNFWMSTDPEQMSELNVNYIPNYKVKVGDDFSYVLDLQKQPGAMADNVNLSIKFPNGYSPQNVGKYDSNSNTLNLNILLDKDRTIKIKFKKD